MSLLFHAPLTAYKGTGYKRETIQNSFTAYSSLDALALATDGSSPYGSYLNTAARGTSAGGTWLKFNPDLGKLRHISICFWGNLITTSGTQWADVFSILTKPDGPNAAGSTRVEFNGYNFVLFSNNLLTSASGALVLAKAVASSGWHHYIYDIDIRSDKTYFKLYVDGDLYTSTVTSYGSAYFDNEFLIGDTGKAYLECHLSDFRIYSGSLSKAQMKELLMCPYLQINSNVLASSDSIADSSTMGAMPTAKSLSYSSDTKKGTNSLLMNGTSSVITCDQLDEYLDSDNITICAWLNPTDSSNYRGVIGPHTTATGGGMVFMQYENGNYVVGGSNTTDGWITNMTIPGWTNSWKHICLVKTGTTAKLYVNGSLYASSSSYNPSSSNKNIVIGRAYEQDNRYFKGNISDIRIYCTALTESQIYDIIHKQAYIGNENDFHASAFTEGASSISLTNTGALSAAYIVENQYLELDDGSKFLKIFSHDVTSDTTCFADANEAKFNVTATNRFSRLLDLNSFKSTSGKYEFLFKFPEVEDAFQELEYIKSTGTQYIDTGIKPDQDTSIEVKAYTSTATSTYGSTAAYLNVTANDNGTYFYWNGYDTGSKGNNSDTSVTIYKQDKNKAYRNGNLVGEWEYTTWAASNTIYLCGRNNAGLSDAGTTQIYYCKIWSNGVLVRDLIPARYKDGRIGMYDRRNNSFYINAGTGTFEAGPVKRRMMYNRWRQTADPLTTYADSQTVSSMGYEPVEISYTTKRWGLGLGLSRNGSAGWGFMNTQSDNTDGNWWGSIGQFKLYNGGFPCPDNAVHKIEELYVRVDNINYKAGANMASTNNGNVVYMDEFIEE